VDAQTAEHGREERSSVYTYIPYSATNKGRKYRNLLDSSSLLLEIVRKRIVPYLNLRR